MAATTTTTIIMIITYATAILKRLHSMIVIQLTIENIVMECNGLIPLFHSQMLLMVHIGK